ncbi:hypothetical protein N8932_03425 [Alphaproteobacteria bacterium]|nr:hypothetical protein [Alphaproteobacteria bacterium]
MLTGGGNKVFGKQEKKPLNYLTDFDWPEASFDPNEPILDIIENLGLSYTVKNVEDINEKSVIETLISSQLSLFIFSGFGGNLLKKDTLNTKKIIFTCSWRSFATLRW